MGDISLWLNQTRIKCEINQKYQNFKQTYFDNMEPRLSTMLKDIYKIIEINFQDIKNIKIEYQQRQASSRH